jgi:hypothetical protein
VTGRVARWLEEAVIGLNLCPFARAVYDDGLVGISICQATTLEEAVHEALGEARRLVDAPADDLATTLVAFPRALSSFDEFLDAVALFEGLLSEAGAEGVLQVATFHPDYQFAQSAPSDLGNYTNRAPCPIFHLLRQSDVSAAVDQHPDSEGIPAANIARLQSIGRDALEKLWEQFD